MRKLMIVASMLAIVLVAAAPAFASTAIGGNEDVVDSDQIQASLTIQRNSGND
jgi:Tfp pilus assembly protein FimT